MASHTKIESNPVLSRLTSESLEKQEYTTILLRYFGFFQPLETALETNGVSQLLPDFQERKRTPRLKEDLLALGFSESDLERAPLCADLPSVSTPSDLFGVMYVTEGSNLGGMLIAKHLKQFSFFDETNGHFFTESPPVVSARWKKFIELLEQSPGLDEPRVLAAASDTFTKLDSWMDGAVRTPDA